MFGNLKKKKKKNADTYCIYTYTLQEKKTIRRTNKISDMFHLPVYADSTYMHNIIWWRKSKKRHYT